MGCEERGMGALFFSLGGLEKRHNEKYDGKTSPIPVNMAWMFRQCSIESDEYVRFSMCFTYVNT